MNTDFDPRKIESRLAKLAPACRGLLAEPSGGDDVPHWRVILESLTSDGDRAFVASDHWQDLKRCLAPLADFQSPPLRLRELDYDAPSEQLRAGVRAAIRDHVETHAQKPLVILAPDVGILHVVQRAGERDAPLRNEVAVVTGAAGAIGAGICRGLLQNGCRVAATDLPGERLDNLVAEFAETAGDRIIGVPLDVTDVESVTAGFNAVVRQWGGVDIVIVNAGVPLVSSIVEMVLDEFRLLEKVNVEGALLTLAEAGRLMRLQGTGGDIVLISTKNVFSPGARFGAYSATKAGAHQLARIASLELAPFDIRVNMVAPDAVFADGERKSGLWETIGPDRMRDKGLSAEDLPEHYKNRSLLKARVTAQHVANAVLFFVTRKTPTTGATIPVDGGLPDATPR